jgi:multimeric flavodoxin WrbA
VKGNVDMKLLIHDLDEEKCKELLPSTIDNLTILSDNGSMQHCIGCFGCWIKTPGACVIRDSYGDIGECLSKCDEVMVISKCFYGGYSPFIKNVMDRCNPYMHPYFEIRNREMHHRRRYNNHFDLKVWFYGENITEQEKQTAEKLIQANAINKDCSVSEVTFLQDIAEIKGYLMDGGVFI